MTRTALISLALCLLPTPLALAGSVGYFGTGTATGWAIPRAGQDVIELSQSPASLLLSYTYNPDTLTFSGLQMSAFVPAASLVALATESPTIGWSNDAISFRAVASAPGLPSAVVISLSFYAPNLTQNMTPLSLSGLVGVPGSFHAEVNPSVGGYRNGLGWFSGTVASTPEPSALLMLAIGVAGVAIVTRIGVQPA